MRTRPAAVAVPFILFLLLASTLRPLPAAERVTVTVLATTDMHGFIYPHDYFTAKSAARGLAAAATLVEQVRRETPNMLLVDGGDTIQGSTLAGVHQTAVRAGTSTAPDPMMLAMNAVGYDAMMLGNHEFNYGLGNLSAARQAGALPVALGEHAHGQRHPALRPVHHQDGWRGEGGNHRRHDRRRCREWEKPEQITGLSWLSPEEGVRARARTARWRAARRDIVGAHGGLDRDPATGTVRPGEMPGDNRVWQIAERFPQLAAVVYGHSHQRKRDCGSGRCCWCSRATGRWTWRGSTSRCRATRRTAAGRSTRAPAACCP